MLGGQNQIVVDQGRRATLELTVLVRKAQKDDGVLLSRSEPNCCGARCLMTMRAGWVMGINGDARQWSQRMMAIA
jgi:hypothetical protein